MKWTSFITIPQNYGQETPGTIKWEPTLSVEHILNPT